MIRWADCKTKKQRQEYHTERTAVYRKKYGGPNKQWRAKQAAFEAMSGHYWDVLPVERRVKRLLKAALL